MNLAQDLKNKLHKAKQLKNKRISARQMCLLAGLPESTYYRGLKTGFSQKNYDTLVAALERLKRGAAH